MHNICITTNLMKWKRKSVVPFLPRNLKLHSPYEKTQKTQILTTEIVTKFKLWQKSNCDKIQNGNNKWCIRETKNLSTDADSSTDILVSASRLIAFFCRRRRCCRPRSFLAKKYCSKKINIPRRGGGGGQPMRGKDLIMWSEGQWEALKKITWNGGI